MTRRFLLLLSAIALLVGMLPVAAQTAGADSGRFQPAPGRGASLTLDDLGRNPDAMVDVFIQFTTPSVARFTADRVEATGTEPSQGQQLAQADAIGIQHDVMRSALSSMLVELRSAQRYALNGFTAVVRAGDIATIRQIPGVLSVMRIQQHYPEHGLSVPSVGAPTVWGDYGFTGDGLTIAIIDSGIDYHHATFGGSGDPADYAADDGLSTNAFFPNAKVVDGWDFVGDLYDGSNAPSPDASPLDCDTGNAGGHGTHVSGTAGGFGVLANGDTFAGTYDADTFADNDFLVGPGVAPDAKLIGLRVFGCSGSSGVVHEALEWVVAYNVIAHPGDEIHVVNMSLGSAFGDATDPSAVAAEAAVDSGIIVVAASGNSGNVPYITGSPGVTPGVISVAGSIAGGTIDVAALSVTAPEDIVGTYPMEPAAFGAALADPGVSGTLVAGASATGIAIEGCTPLANAAEVAGNVVLLRRGTCPFVDKYASAVAAGAIGLVVYNNTGGPPIAMGGDAAGTIPAVMVADTTGALLLSALSGVEDVTVLIESGITTPLDITPDEPYASSSRGPGRGGSTFKPEVTAPAVNVESADVGTGTGGVRFSGTSMATPHVAGISAMLREAHPDAPPSVIKSLMMNSGRPLNPETLPITRQAAGIVEADVAVELGAYTSPGGVSFGRLNPVMAGSYTQEVTVNDLSGVGDTYDIEIDALGAVAGVTVSAPDSVTVAADGSASFELTLDLDPSAMPEDDAFQSQLEAYGRISLVGTSETLNLPYNAVVDAASDANVGFQNIVNDGDTGSFMYSTTLIGEGGGFQGVGVATQDVGFDMLAFTIAAEEAFESPNHHVVDVWIDDDQDGTADYLIRAADLNVLTAVAGYSGQFVSAFFVLAGGGSLEFFVETDFNNRVMTLLVEDYGLINGDFDYEVDFYDLREDGSLGLLAGSGNKDEAVDVIFHGIEAGETLVKSDLGSAAGPGILWTIPNNPLATQAQVSQAMEPTVGAFDPNTGEWHLRDSLGEVTTFYFGNPGDMPLVGDWDGDGVDTVGLYRQSDGFVYLRNSNTAGIGEISFFFGNPGDIPLAGDWDNDGFDTVSLYRPSTGQVFIINELGEDGGGLGQAEFSYYFGNPGDKPFAGDFNGDGTDTVGLHRESQGLLYFRNSHTPGVADFQFYFGNPGDRLFAGDFGVVDLEETPGVFRPSQTMWYFRHSNTQGNADSQFMWGQSHWLPVAGHFGLDAPS